MSSGALSRTSTRLPAIAAMGALFTYAVVLTLPQASVNEIAREFRVSNDALGTIFSLLMLGFFCAAVTGGTVADRVGKLPVVAAGCLLMAVAMLVFQKSSSFNTLRIGALLAGFGGGLAEVVATAMISDMYHGPQRTSMINWSQVVFSSGAFIQPLLFAKMLSVGIGWRYGYAIVAGLGVLAAVVATMGSVQARNVRAEHDAERVGSWVILSNPTVLRMAFALLLYIGGELGLASWVAVYLERDLRTSAEVAAASVAVFWIGIGAGRLAATWLALRLSDDLLIKLSLGLGAVSMAVLLVVKSPTLALAMVFLVGLPLGPAWPTIVSRASYVFPGQTGSVVGVIAAAGCLGGAVLPSVIGRISDSLGIRMGLWACVAALLVGLTATVAGEMREQRNARPD